MVSKTMISCICELYRFYPVLPMGKTDCFTQFYPTGFTHWVKVPCQPCECVSKTELHGDNDLSELLHIYSYE